MKRGGKLYIYGRHAVAEALRHAPQVVRRLYLAGAGDKALRDAARAANIPQEPLDERKVTSMVEGRAAHQGVVAQVSLEELLTPAEKFIAEYAPAPQDTLLFLSGIQDPHNVGAIIRSAAALGARAVVLPTHKQSPITPAVIKASAGMAFQIPLIAADNPQQAIAQLKKKGVRVYGLAADGTQGVATAAGDEPALLVLGNEAEGIAPYATALCDKILRIDIAQSAESLNVAASAAIALYARRGR